MIRLSINYRSARLIVNDSVNLIFNNNVRFDKRIAVYRKEIGKMCWIRFDLGIDQAGWIVTTINSHDEIGYKSE